MSNSRPLPFGAGGWATIFDAGPVGLEDEWIPLSIYVGQSDLITNH